MKEREAEGVEWFAAWLPKSNVSEIDRRPAVEPIRRDPIDEVRQELQAVAGHLIDPSTKGVRACLPHLERAVTTFSAYVKVHRFSTLEPSLGALRQELALASMLFENAYTLQAGWAAQLGLNLDGTPKQLLYTRPGQQAQIPAPQAAVAHDIWEG